MSADWKPVVIKPQPVAAPVVKETAPQVIVMPAENEPRARQWEFIPERDPDTLLIVRIVATPIY